MIHWSWYFLLIPSFWASIYIPKCPITTSKSPSALQCLESVCDWFPDWLCSGSCHATQLPDWSLNQFHAPWSLLVGRSKMISHSQFSMHSFWYQCLVHLVLVFTLHTEKWVSEHPYTQTWHNYWVFVEDYSYIFPRYIGCYLFSVMLVGMWLCLHNPAT